MADDGGGRRRLLDRLASARARHHERHRPSGFGFALGDSIRYLDAAQWDAACAGQSLFLQRRYLQVLASDERLDPAAASRRAARRGPRSQSFQGSRLQVLIHTGVSVLVQADVGRVPCAYM